MATGNSCASRSKRRSLETVLNVIIYPAPDLEGQWLAHCLETDLIVQESSVQDAVEAMAEVIEEIAKHNVSMGRPAIVYRNAPPEVYAMHQDAEDLATRILWIPSDALTNEIKLSPHVVAEPSICAG